MKILSLIILAIALTFLLIIQYTMVISDWRNNKSEVWEKIVGLIPFGPYILMILTAIWYLIRKLFKR